MVLAIYLGRSCSTSGLAVSQKHQDASVIRPHLLHPSLPKADIGWWWKASNGICGSGAVRPLLVTKQLLVFLLSLDESFLE